MLSPAKTIVSVRSGSIGKEMQFIIQGDEIKCLSPQGEIKISDCCVHFSIPPSTWWRDVRFACGTIHFFASRKEAEEWPRKRAFHAGDILSLETAWLLSKVRRNWDVEMCVVQRLTLMKEWYHNKHEYGYDRKTPDQVRDLYSRLGMTSDFWTS